MAEIGKIAGELNNSAEQMSAVIQQMNAQPGHIQHHIPYSEGGRIGAPRTDTSHTMEMMSTQMQEMAERRTFQSGGRKDRDRPERSGGRGGYGQRHGRHSGAAEAVVEASTGLEERFMQIHHRRRHQRADQTNCRAQRRTEAARGRAGRVSRWWRRKSAAWRRTRATSGADIQLIRRYRREQDEGSRLPSTRSKEVRGG